MSQADPAATPQSSPAGPTRQPSEHPSLPGSDRVTIPEEEAPDAPEPVLPTDHPPLIGIAAPATPPALASAPGVALHHSPKTPPLATILADEATEIKKKIGLLTRGRETAGFAISLVAEAEKAKIEDSQAEAWTGQSDDNSLTPEQYWYQFDPEGKRHRLNQIVAEVAEKKKAVLLCTSQARATKEKP